MLMALLTVRHIRALRIVPHLQVQDDARDAPPPLHTSPPTTTSRYRIAQMADVCSACSRPEMWTSGVIWGGEEQNGGSFKWEILVGGDQCPHPLKGSMAAAFCMPRPSAWVSHPSMGHKQRLPQHLPLPVTRSGHKLCLPLLSAHTMLATMPDLTCTPRCGRMHVAMNPIGGCWASL